MRFLFLLCCLLVFVISGCDDDANNTAEDSDTSLITSCNIDEMQKIGIITLNLNQEMDICNIMVSSLNRNPPVYLLRSLFTITSLVDIDNQKNSNNQSVKDIAYQAMNIIKARNQENNNTAIKNTFNTIWKIYEGTQGQVTFEDLNTQLNDAGKAAETMSDNGLISFASLIWEEKKDQGG